MLLDRRRINKWARWVALFLAIVFGAGFLFMGIGYGGAGFNLSEIFTRDKTPDINAQTPEGKIAAYETMLAQNPNDLNALLGIATVYQQNDDLASAATYLSRALDVDPNQKDLYIRLANIYMASSPANNAEAVKVLNKATAVDPSNPDVYLKLGTAQNGMGNTEAALLAWQKYLQLAPSGEYADIIREQVNMLSKKATTTTVADESTTTSGVSETTTPAVTTATPASTVP